MRTGGWRWGSQHSTEAERKNRLGRMGGGSGETRKPGADSRAAYKTRNTCFWKAMKPIERPCNGMDDFAVKAPLQVENAAFWVSWKPLSTGVGALEAARRSVLCDGLKHS